MSSSEEPVKKQTWVEYLHLHFVITIIFFFLILINIISLTMSTVNMNVPSSDIDATTAKNLMISAEVITYAGLLIILIFLGVTYSYSSHKTANYYEKMMGLTGAEDIYTAMRVVTFSILMFISIVVSALCLEAANYISKSDNSDEYTDQYNLCKDLGRMFFIHFVVFSSIQGVSYIYEIYKDGQQKYNDPSLVGAKINKYGKKYNIEGVNISDWE